MATLIGSLTVVLTAIMALSSTAVAWNIPGHMLSATITYQILQQENPQAIEKVKALLEKHPWYANQWQARLQDVPIAERDQVLFMQATRWADDIRSNESSSTVRSGTTSTGPSSLKDNQQAYKPGNPSQ